MASAKNVAVEMRNRFTPVRTVVQHETIAGFLETECARDLGCFQKEMAQHRVILGCGLRNSRDGFARHDQHMDRRLRIDILERHHLVVLVNNRRGDLLIGNLLEKRLTHRDDVC